MKSFTLSLIICVLLFRANAQNTSITDIKLESGCPYFKIGNLSEYPLMVREPIENKFIYCFVGFDDKNLIKAYNNGIPFTGVAQYVNSNGNILGLYSFKNGLVERLEEFSSEGILLKSMCYENGFAHGESKEFNTNGSLRFLFTYKNGQKDGGFYTVFYTDIPDCRTSIKEGYYDCGEEIIVTKRCE